MNRCFLSLLLLLSLSAVPGSLAGQDLPLPPQESGTAVTAAEAAVEDLGDPVKVVLLLTILTILPALVMTMTCFTRIIIVLGFVRRALSVQEIPPNQVLVGLSIFLTLVIMSPVIGEIEEQALTPYMAEEITLLEAGERAADSMASFIRSQTSENDVVLITDLTGAEQPETIEELSLTILVPAFVLSELRTAFEMGFLIYLPFLVVDLIVASVLLSMGMFMLPPVIISTPFKILLFILVDGWGLVVRSLVESFQNFNV